VFSQEREISVIQLLGRPICEPQVFNLSILAWQFRKKRQNFGKSLENVNKFYFVYSFVFQRFLVFGKKAFLFNMCIFFTKKIKMISMIFFFISEQLQGDMSTWSWLFKKMGIIKFCEIEISSSFPKHFSWWISTLQTCFEASLDNPLDF
jgi:hypothetical protein